MRTRFFPAWRWRETAETFQTQLWGDYELAKSLATTQEETRDLEDLLGELPPED